MSEENKALHRRFFEELLSTGNLQIADEIIAADYVNHDPANPPVSPGPEGAKELVRHYRAIFPDLRFTIEDQIAEGDKVVSRWTSRGTHQGELGDIPPTGRQVQVTGIAIDRISGAKIAQHWSNWDTLGMMQQLGVIPAP